MATSTLTRDNLILHHRCNKVQAMAAAALRHHATAEQVATDPDIRDRVLADAHLKSAPSKTTWELFFAYMSRQGVYVK